MAKQVIINNGRVVITSKRALIVSPIKIKDRTGEIKTFNNVNTITVKDTSGNDVVFSSGSGAITNLLLTMQILLPLIRNWLIISPLLLIIIFI